MRTGVLEQEPSFEERKDGEGQWCEIGEVPYSYIRKENGYIKDFGCDCASFDRRLGAGPIRVYCGKMNGALCIKYRDLIRGAQESRSTK